LIVFSNNDSIANSKSSVFKIASFHGVKSISKKLSLNVQGSKLLDFMRVSRRSANDTSASVEISACSDNLYPDARGITIQLGIFSRLPSG
jgi:hypothetical protein